MATPIKMPALSPTMEEGTLAKWLVKEGDEVHAGDIMAEIETDKATMEFEAVDEGTIARIEVAEGTEGVKVGTVIAMLAGEGEDAGEAAAAPAPTAAPAPATKEAQAAPAPAPALPGTCANTGSGPRRQRAQAVGRPHHCLAAGEAHRRSEGYRPVGCEGSGPNGRIVKADVEGAQPGAAAPKSADMPAPAVAAAGTQPSAPTALPDFGIPHEDEKLSNVRKVIARRLTESKQTVPHYYLAIDVRLDPLLKLRGELNKALEAQGIKLSVNDLLIKALAKALLQVPDCNVSFGGDTLRRFSRADISVAVAAPSGLITPVVTDAGAKSISAIASEFKVLVDKAREGKLQPAEYQGGTASLSNLGMYGIKQFEAVINPPQGMIMAVGAGEKRAYVVDDALAIATVMTATGSFDHRAIDGATGAELMQAFKALVEAPLGLVA